MLRQKIEAVIMKINISGNEIKYDSQAKDAADNPLASFFKPLIGSTFTITLDPNTMKVVQGRGPRGVRQEADRRQPADEDAAVGAS